MKHFFYLKILFFSWSLTCSTYLPAQHGLSFKLGLNATSINNPTYDNYKLRPGFLLGIAAYREIVPDILGISLETGISNENTKGFVEIAISEAIHSINLDYWNSALVSNLQLKEGLKVLLGLQYGYLILARSDFDRPDVVHGGNVTTLAFNQTNWSALIGFEKRIATQLKVGVRYCHGLSHISPSSHSSIMFNAMPPENSLKNVRTVQIYINKGIFKEQF